MRAEREWRSEDVTLMLSVAMVSPMARLGPVGVVGVVGEDAERVVLLMWGSSEEKGATGSMWMWFVPRPRRVSMKSSRLQ